MNDVRYNQELSSYARDTQCSQLVNKKSTRKNPKNVEDFSHFGWWKAGSRVLLLSLPTSSIMIMSAVYLLVKPINDRFTHAIVVGNSLQSVLKFLIQVENHSTYHTSKKHQLRKVPLLDQIVMFWRDDENYYYYWSLMIVSNSCRIESQG